MKRKEGLFNKFATTFLVTVGKGSFFQVWMIMRLEKRFLMVVHIKALPLFGNFGGDELDGRTGILFF